MLRKWNREIKLGILFTAGLLLFLWGVNYLKGKAVFSRQTRFYVVYDRVDGLKESNAVILSGVKIGHIHRIAFHPDQSGQVVVTAFIQNDIHIPSNSLAILSSPDLVGEAYLDMVLGDAPLALSNSDTLQGALKGGMMQDFTDQARQLITRADNLISSIQEVFSNENLASMNTAMENAAASSINLNKASGIASDLLDQEGEKISQILSDVTMVTENLASNMENLDHILNNLSHLSEAATAPELKHTIQQLGEATTAISSILQRMDAGEGSAGKLLTDQALYQRLESSSRELELLLEDIRKNPERYFRINIFGR